MAERKSHRLVTGSMLGMTNFVTTALISLFMTPFLLGQFGDRMYGLWMIIGSFTGFYGLLDLGLATAVQRYLSRALGLNDKEEARYVVNSSLVVFAIIGCVAFCISVAGAWLGFLFVSDPSELILFRKLIMVIGLGLSLSFPMRTFWGIFASHLRYDLLAYVELGKVIVRTVVAIIFLTMGCKLLAFALIILLSDVIGYIVSVALSLKIGTYLNFSLKYFKWSQVKKLFGYSIYSFVARIASTIKFSIDNLVIAGILQLTAVTVYSIGTRLMFYFISFMSSSIALMMPVFSQYEAQGNFKEMRRQLMFVTRISTYLGCFIGFILIFLGKPFVERWVGPDYQQSYYVILILIVPLIVSLIQTPGSQLLNGISKHKFLAFLSLGDAAANLVLSLVLVRFYGIYGVAAGTAIPLFVASFFIKPPYLCKQVGLSTRFYYREMIMMTARSFLVMLSIFLVIRPMIKPDYMSLFLSGMVFGVIYVPVVFLTGFNKDERGYLSGVAKGLVADRCSMMAS